MPVALLDYDGYICKSFYANKEDMMDFHSAEKILNDLRYAALDKTADYFKCSRVEVILLPIISGHSWKKDLYPSYKRTRKRDEFLGLYRDEISTRKNVIKIEPLEADELLIVLADYIRTLGDNKYIIFSDDKDLRYYTERYCKINILEEVQEQDPQALIYNQLNQMLIGDKEDNINGLPKVGEKTAGKLLSNVGYTFENVIKLYKDKNIDIDMTLRDLLLLIPLSDGYTEDSIYGYDVAAAILNGQNPKEIDVHNALINQVKFLNKKVKEVYDAKN